MKRVGSLHESDAGFIKVRTIVAVLDVLRELALNEADMARIAGVDLRDFSDPEGIVPCATIGRLAVACAKAASCEEFGFRVGMRMEAATLGIVGLAAVHAPTLGETLYILEKYLKASANGVFVTVTQRNGIVVASTTMLNADFEGAEHFCDASVAHLCNIIREAADRNWRPTEVLLSRCRPANARIFADFYRVPIIYGSTDDGLVFESSELHKPIPGRSRLQYEILVSILERDKDNELGCFRANVKSVMRQQIASGGLNLQRVASVFDMKDRTFVRHLEQAGICFSELADEVRFETARGMLRTNIKFSEIAAVLGYAEAGVFTRSFKRWSGETPSSWRLKYVRAQEADKPELEPAGEADYA